MPRFDILRFGAVAVDELLYVDQYPAAEAKVRVRGRRRQCGGLTGTAQPAKPAAEWREGGVLALGGV